MTLNNLTNFNPPGGQDTDPEAVWLTQWLVQSSTDSFGGRNFFAYAESTNGGALTCFDGDSGTQRIGGGLALTYPGRIAITAPGACTAVMGQNGTITIDVPLVDVAVANPVDASLHEVTASTMSAPGPTECLNSNPNCMNLASPIGVFFNLIDLAKAYTFTRLPSADVQIVKTASATGHVGQTLLYTITVTNNGPDNAVGVTVSDQLPKNAGFGSASASQGSCTLKPQKRLVVCNLGDLGSAGTATVSMAVKPTTKGTITNTATVSDTSPLDPNPNNNTSSATTSISP
jgi:uncharacterized repeat protein (TIGR01451 family)